VSGEKIIESLINLDVLLDWDRKKEKGVTKSFKAGIPKTRK